MSNFTAEQMACSPADLILQAHKEMKALHEDVEKRLIGRTARIVSKYNGQLHGRSKPTQTGQQARIECIHIDPTDNEPQIKLEGRSLYLWLREVEIL